MWSLVFLAFSPRRGRALVLLSEVLVLEDVAHLDGAFLLHLLLALHVVFVGLIHLLVLVESFVGFVRDFSLLVPLERLVTSSERSSSSLCFLVLVGIVHAIEHRGAESVRHFRSRLSLDEIVPGAHISLERVLVFNPREGAGVVFSHFQSSGFCHF